MLLTALQLVAHGRFSGGANLFPRLDSSLVESFRANDQARAEALEEPVQRVGDLLFRIGKRSFSIIKGIQCGLSCLGVCDEYTAEPSDRFHSQERARLQRGVGELQAGIAGFRL